MSSTIKMASKAALLPGLLRIHGGTLLRLASKPSTAIGHRSFATGNCLYSESKSGQELPEDTAKKPEDVASQPKKVKKTQTELDEELRLKMQGLSGDGGEAGVELEDGQPVSMKRSVRENMFRYI